MNGILFRVDASEINIGSGHLFRCVNLAKELQEYSFKINFLLRDLPGDFDQIVTRNGFDLIKLPLNKPNKYKTSNFKNSWLGESYQIDAEQTLKVINKLNISCVIVDHYSLDKRWHKLVSRAGIKIVVIDDLANRQIECDLLIDQSYKRIEDDYRGLINLDSVMLLGSKYAILASEFYRKRGEALIKRKSSLASIRNILISFGGVDPNNYSKFTLEILNELKSSLNIEIILGKAYSKIEELKECCENSRHNIKISKDINSSEVSSKMIQADLAFGSPGISTWERACFELPTIFIVNNHNLERIKHYVGDTKDNYLINANESKNDLLMRIMKIMKKTNKNKINFNLIDGLGARRVALYIHQMILKHQFDIFLRPINIRDKELMFEWQSDKNIRKYFNIPSIPLYDEHLIWINDRLKSSDATQMIIFKDEPVGILRVDFLGASEDSRCAYEISIYVSSEYQKLGIASAAIKLILNIYRYELLIANINIKNLSSIKLFKKNGFVQISDRRYKYDNLCEG